MLFTPSRLEAARIGAELKRLADALARAHRLKEIPLQVLIYHAGLDDRAATEKMFASTKGVVVMATIAFGLRVHCSHVQSVLHFVRLHVGQPLRSLVVANL